MPYFRETATAGGYSIRHTHAGTAGGMVQRLQLTWRLISMRQYAVLLTTASHRSFHNHPYARQVVADAFRIALTLGLAFTGSRW